MTEAQLKAIVDKLADITSVLRVADPDDKAEIFRQLGLKLTYHPGRQLVQAQIAPAQYWQLESDRGRYASNSQCILSTEFVLDGGAR